MRKRSGLWVPGTPHLWTRRQRFSVLRLTAPTVRVEGRFKEVALVDPESGDVVKKYSFPNLVLDQGLDLAATQNMGSTSVSADNAGVLMYCRVGTGSSTPVASQTTLDNQIAATYNRGGFYNGYYWGPNNEYYVTEVTKVFTQTEANGNLTEVGMGRNASTDLFSRQLILDEVGQPTTLTKTTDYQLRVIYELRVYLPQGDVLTTMTVDGTQRNVTGRVADLNNWDTAYPLGHDLVFTYTGSNGARLWQSDGVLGNWGSTPTGVSVYPDSVEVDPYVAGSFTKTGRSIWGPAVANATVGYSIFMTAILASRPFQFQWDGGAITKTADYRFVLEHSRSWGRYVP